MSHHDPKMAEKAINTPTPKLQREAEQAEKPEAKSDDQNTPIITDYASL